jgi:predicted small integral membrane protein
MIDLSWMAWTQPTATFFLVIAGLILSMSVWEYFSPGGGPRVGILRFETTRGDRLFVSLLGSAFICLAWLGLMSTSLWWGVLASILFAVIVFRFV